MPADVSQPGGLMSILPLFRRWKRRRGLRAFARTYDPDRDVDYFVETR